ncbi:OmpA family protein [Agriterribacter sp.]|uniref:OmpA family protein n=1 Tax=Agriterribacter sp. TaxID=2821509 RepID=UPI002CB9C412|nr:OmpA family protein [Agriterribacter sp.]HRP55579.1 OmpA family protein [Agriterribacter sp.]
MKTLLIITSIILLSFQIDRLLVINLSDASEEIPSLTNAFSVPESIPDIQAAKSNIDVVVADETIPGALTLKPAEKNIEKSSPAKVKSGMNRADRVNSKNSILHHDIKQSGKYLELGTLLFDFDEYKNIETEEFNTILQLADRLIFDGSLKVSIAGFTDNTGNEEYNKKLSRLRAENVKHYMLDLGVSESQIIISANGISHPVANNNTQEGRTANRRVEMLLIQ